MKNTLRSLALALTLTPALGQGFDFGLTWDAAPTNALADVFMTNVTSFASITGFSVYRATALTRSQFGTNDFVLLQTSTVVTNVVRLTNQPLAMAYYYVTWTGPFGESRPSNTNQVFPPMPPPDVGNVKGRR